MNIDSAAKHEVDLQYASGALDATGYWAALRRLQESADEGRAARRLKRTRRLRIGGLVALFGPIVVLTSWMFIDELADAYQQYGVLGVGVGLLLGALLVALMVWQFRD